MAKGSVSWLSKKQSVVALSTSEAEYVALSSATQEAYWIRRLIEDLTKKVPKPTVIKDDNQGAIALSKNPIGHARTKHIDIRYHYIREAVQAKTIEVQCCQTKEMIADLLTKPLAGEQFKKLRQEIGIAKQPAD